MTTQVKVHEGDRYGMLTIIRETKTTEAGVGKHGYIRYQRNVLCRCDCGKALERNFDSMRAGGVRSCGCILGKSRRPKQTFYMIFKRFINYILCSIGMTKSSK